MRIIENRDGLKELEHGSVIMDSESVVLATVIWKGDLIEPRDIRSWLSFGNSTPFDIHMITLPVLVMTEGQPFMEVVGLNAKVTKSQFQNSTIYGNNRRDSGIAVAFLAGELRESSKMVTRQLKGGGIVDQVEIDTLVQHSNTIRQYAEFWNDKHTKLHLEASDTEIKEK